MSEKSRDERARERITDGAPVEILTEPQTAKTVRGLAREVT